MSSLRWNIYTPLEGGRGVFRFQVKDTGIGIPAEHLQEIFFPFYQVGNIRTGREGTGLGLAISQQLVHLMGSELHVRSPVGQGTTFWFDIELPVVTEVITSTTDVIASGYPEPFDSAQDRLRRRESRHIIGYSGKRRTLLIVDDNAENRAMLSDALSPLGFAIMEAGDGREALNKLVIASEVKQSHPDLIFMDLFMPGMDGFEATRVKGFDIGGVDYITKPVHHEEVLARINAHLTNHRLHQQLREEKVRFQVLSEATFEGILIHEEGRILEGVLKG